MRALLVAMVVVSSAVAAGQVRADATGPRTVPLDVVRPDDPSATLIGRQRPVDCRAGLVPVPQEDGSTACLTAAPTDCPDGWYGAPGLGCMLRLCGGEHRDRCDAGLECVSQALCIKASGLMGYAPDGPYDVHTADQICAAKVACERPAFCQTERLCVPKGKTATPYFGDRSSVDVKPRPEIPRNEAPVSKAPAAAVSLPPSPRGGCAGCAAGGSGEALPLVTIVVLWALARRPKR